MPAEVETGFIISLASCWNDSLLSTGCKDVGAFARDVATIFGAIAIPVVIWVATNRREKKQATLNLINTLYTVPEVIDRLARLYRYRKYEEAGKTTKLQNPYDDQNSYDVLFDTATVLNYFEAACVQIKQKAVYKKLIYESGSRQLIGVRQVILGRFVAMTGIDPALAYPNLIEIADEFERPDSSVLVKIPNAKHNED